MATYREIASTETDPQAPVTSALMKALDANPTAISEGATDAPIVRAGWHPYDAAFIGDGNDGLVYSSAVSGSVATITSPDFEDGYEYRFRFYEIDAGSSAFQLELYRETDATYGSILTIASGGGGATKYSGEIMLPRVRVSVKAQPSISWAVADDTSGAITGVEKTLACVRSAQKRTRARISKSSGNITSGLIYMDRRLLLV